MKRYIYSIVAIIAIGLSAPVIADHGSYHNCGSCKKMQKLETELNLTATQKEKITEIKKQSKDEFKSTLNELKALKKEMKDFVKSETMDDKKLDELVTKKTELTGKLMKIKLKMKHEIYNILDEDQKTKFNKIMEDHHAKRS